MQNRQIKSYQCAMCIIHMRKEHEHCLNTVCNCPNETIFFASPAEDSFFFLFAEDSSFFHFAEDSLLSFLLKTVFLLCARRLYAEAFWIKQFRLKQLNSSSFSLRMLAKHSKRISIILFALTIYLMCIYFRWKIYFSVAGI